MSGGTYTREVNGNHALRLGDVLREVEDVDVGDAVEFTVEKVHRDGE